MARRSFAYTKFDIPASAPFPNGQTIFWPRLVTQIVGPSGIPFVCMACLDTGADQCTFPLSFAYHIGYDYLTMPMQLTGGCGSSANSTYYADIEIRILVNVGNSVETLSFNTSAGFTTGMEPQGIGLLGGCGFLKTTPSLLTTKTISSISSFPDSATTSPVADQKTSRRNFQTLPTSSSRPKGRHDWV